MVHHASWYAAHETPMSSFICCVYYWCILANRHNPCTYLPHSHHVYEGLLQQVLVLIVSVTFLVCNAVLKR